MSNIAKHLFDYLEKKLPSFSKIKKSGQHLFTCPKVTSHKFKSKTPTATFLPNSNKITCLVCGFKGSVYDCIRVLEEDKKNLSDADITNYLIKDLKLDMYKELEYYKKYNWSLVALLQNSKSPFESNWREIENKEKVKWIKWLNNGLNIGVNCEKSNILVIDVDVKKLIKEEIKPLRQEIISLCEKADTLTQTTPSGGKHFVFLWDEELKKQKVNIGGTQIDTRTEGQIVIAPSRIDKKEYTWLNLGTEIKKIPKELKSKLLKIQTVEKSRNAEEINEELDLPSYKGEKPNLVNNNLEGCCNDSFVKFGGVLTKIGIPAKKRNTILHWLNKNWLENPMQTKDVQAMLKSLDGYEVTTEENHEKAIYEFLKIMQTDVSPNDIVKGVFNNDQTKAPLAYKYLSQFVRDGRAIRVGWGRYHYKEKVQWSDSAPEVINECDYKIPFFNNIAVFQDADCLILGGKTNEGKTTIALNMFVEIIKQGIKPYYIYNEAGSRFQKTAKMLGIVGKFYHCQHSNPLAIELERNAFTILDWLCLENKAETDTVLKHINDELQRKRGILVIFTQLKKDYEWFAPNLIDHFPTFAARYIQDNENHTEGHWQCDKIKEPRGNYTTYIIPCEYNHDTRVFKPKDLI